MAGEPERGRAEGDAEDAEGEWNEGEELVLSCWLSVVGCQLSGDEGGRRGWRAVRCMDPVDLMGTT